MTAMHAHDPDRHGRAMCGRRLDPPFIRAGIPVTCGTCMKAQLRWRRPKPRPAPLPKEAEDKSHIHPGEWEAVESEFLNYCAMHGVFVTADRLGCSPDRVGHWLHGSGKPNRGAYGRICALLDAGKKSGAGRS